ncbi:MAG: hypothetical protein V8T87_09610 [Victivallales bacterium]
MIKSGFSPEEAKKLANARIFGGGNGEDDGPGVGQMTQSGNEWEDPRSWRRRSSATAALFTPRKTGA